ncbi:colicin D domain-containing protein [Opitutus sp. ER46]|uniref:RHS repeat-associated core domain-containing protein n=1 Tax=Opitutus sp. ER46 TaxID=2161864 RepID=UPI001304C78F|nr:colicin D domain-containing protein [Opitutus sp. ER46]
MLAITDLRHAGHPSQTRSELNRGMCGRNTSSKKVGTTTVGLEFLYDARRSRTVQLEYDQTSATHEPSHYVRKRLYAVGPALEVNYDNTAANGAPTAWHMNLVRVYVPGPEGVIGTRELTPDTSAEKALVYHYDHLGSIEAITPFGSTDGSLAADGGGKAGRFSEDAWGQRRNPLTWSGAPTTTDNGGADSLSPRGFTGHEMLDDLGLIHMNGRIYDPLLGRMLSADIIIQAPLNLQSYNRYSYVMNNPLTLVDPSGFSWADNLKNAIKEAGQLMANLLTSNRVKEDHGVPTVSEEQQGNRELLKGALAEQGKHLEKAAEITNTVVKSTPVLGQVVTATEAVTGKNPLDVTGNTKASRVEASTELLASIVVGAAANKLAPSLTRGGGEIAAALKPGVENVAPGMEKAASQILRTPIQQLQSKFKHAADFGLSGDFSLTQAAKFRSVINQHINSPSVQAIQGTYRKMPAVHYLDGKTRLNVISTPSGEFWTGWRLSDQQFRHVSTTGNLGGG